MARILTFNHKIINPGSNRYFGSFGNGPGPTPPEPTVYDVILTTDGHGTITANPMSGVKDTLITLSNTPAQNYVFSKYTLNNVDLVGNTFLMPEADANVKGWFEADMRTITVTQPSHGTITAPASAQVGSTVTLSCTADDGYALQYFTVNGTQIQGDSFIMPDSDVTVSASMDVAPIVLPTNTIRVKYAQGAEPAEGSAYGSRLWDSRTLVDQTDNIWDLTRSDGNWEAMFWGNVSNPSQGTVLEVLAANLTNVSNPTSLFSYQGNLTAVKNVTTSSTLTTVKSMFSNCANLARVDLFYTGNVTDFRHTFYGCSSLESIPDFDTSRGTNFMNFCNQTKITTAPDIDTSRAENFEGMFNGCSRLTSVPQYVATNVTNVQHMFAGCTSLTEVTLFNTSNITSFTYMFSGCTNLQRIPSFTISGASCNLSWMFLSCPNVESGMLDLYNRFSQMSPESYKYQGIFRYCGTNTVTGQAELDQIPSDWK